MRPDGPFADVSLVPNRSLAALDTFVVDGLVATVAARFRWAIAATGPDVRR
jgi:hypothetical protein